MEHTSSSARRYGDSNSSRQLTNGQIHDRAWSPTSRPTLNTSLVNHPNSSNMNQQTPSLDSPLHSSPWPQSLNPGLGQGYLLPQLNTSNLGSDLPPPMQGAFSNDWGNPYPPQMHPNAYAALAVNGGLGSVSSSPSAGTPSLSSSYHSSYQTQLSSAPPGSWSQSQSPTNFKFPPGFPGKPTLSRSGSDLRGKLTGGMSHSRLSASPYSRGL